MNTQADLNSTQRQRPTRWLRIAALIWGLVTFLWLAPEDDSVLPALLLGLVLSALITGWIFIRLGAFQPLQRWWAFLLASVVGAVVGGGTSLSTVLLLLLKNARHAHLYPDYPPELLLETLARFPSWSVAGALTGVGLIFLHSLARPG